MPGQGNYWDYLILGRVLRPHQGDTVSPRRGLKFPATNDTWKGIEADGQHKTRFRSVKRKSVSCNLLTDVLYLAQSQVGSKNTNFTFGKIE